MDTMRARNAEVVRCPECGGIGALEERGANQCPRCGARWPLVAPETPHLGQTTPPSEQDT